jgi:hypothetical protein
MPAAHAVKSKKGSNAEDDKDTGSDEGTCAFFSLGVGGHGVPERG